MIVRPGDSIQDAINVAVNNKNFGSTVRVKAGGYKQSLYLPDNQRCITVQGETPETVSIYASDFWTIYVAGGRWRLSGFKFEHGMIHIEVSNNAVCELGNCVFGASGNAGVHFYSSGRGMLTILDRIDIEGPFDEMVVCKEHSQIDFNPTTLVFRNDPVMRTQVFRVQDNAVLRLFPMTIADVPPIPGGGVVRNLIQDAYEAAELYRKEAFQA